MSADKGESLEVYLGTELDRRAAELTRQWLDRLLARLAVSPRRVFPSETLLNRMPEVLKAVSTYLCSGGTGAADMVREELGKLARLRREQGYDVDELLAEFEILGEILFSALKQEAESFGAKVAPTYAIEVSERLYRALASIAAVTAATFRAEGFRDRRERARLLGSFGRDLAHELGNRLGTAEAALYLFLQPGVEPATRDKAAAALANSLRHIKGIADDVRALAIAQSSEETAQGRRRSLRVLLHETLAELAGLAGEREVRLEAQEPIPEVQVDATRCELALINLIGNAVKYSDPGKPERWVRISVRRGEEGFWQVAIADNGLGIPAGMKDLVFKQFVRAHPAIADGTGLGLAIAREAVEQIGGRIWLESEAGAGTTFYFTVPDPPAARA